MGLGEDMCDAHNNGAEMPQAVDIEDDDPENLKAVKSLINSMTAFEPSNRPISSATYEEMLELSLITQQREDDSKCTCCRTDRLSDSELDSACEKILLVNL